MCWVPPAQDPTPHRLLLLLQGVVRAEEVLVGLPPPPAPPPRAFLKRRTPVAVCSRSAAATTMTETPTPQHSITVLQQRGQYYSSTLFDVRSGIFNISLLSSRTFQNLVSIFSSSLTSVRFVFCAHPSFSTSSQFLPPSLNLASSSHLITSPRCFVLCFLPTFTINSAL